MPTLDESFPALLAALIERYGRPADSSSDAPFLAVAAAALAGDVAPSVVDKSRDVLADHDLLAPRALAETDAITLTEAFREGGLSLPRKAVGALLRLARWLAEGHGGDAASLDALSTEALRGELAAINGIGRATADALLLHALHRPVYPLDRATYRVFVRHGWLEPSADYDEARAVVERLLADDPLGLARLSALMERVAREFCRAAAPRCERCPLRPWLPDGGPVDPGA